MGAMQFEPTLEFARAQDEADPLRAYRERFHFPSLGTRELVYFTGHSLGLQPKAVRAAVELELEEWAKYGVEGHFHSTNPWYSYHELLTPPMAQLVGAKESEVVCMNSLTTNIHLLFVSFYRPTQQRYKIISEAKMFPSDRYLLETQTQFHGFDPDDAIIEVAPREGERLIREEDILEAGGHPRGHSCQRRRARARVFRRRQFFHGPAVRHAAPDCSGARGRRDRRVRSCPRGGQCAVVAA
jgi:kynureninase